MNPLHMPGPEFLGVFIVLFGAAFGARKLGWKLLRAPGGEARPERLNALTPYEVAYLGGGPAAVVDAAVTALVHEGRVAFDGGVVSRTPTTGSATAVGGGAYRNVGGGSDGHAVELAVLARVRKHNAVRIQALREALRSVSEPLGATLRPELVLGPNKLLMVNVLAMLPWLVVALGVAKVFVGKAGHHPVTFLVYLLAVSVVVLLHRPLRSARVTVRGEKALADLRDRNAALETTMEKTPEQATSSECALAYGLFGTAVLGGALAALGTGLASAGSAVDVERKIESGVGLLKNTGGGHHSWLGCGSGCGGCGGGCGGCGG